MKRFMSVEGVVGLLLVLLVMAVVVFGPSLCVHDPNDVHLELKNLEPNSTFYLGTDHLGRCIFTRVVYGARYSIGAAFIALTTTFMFSLFYGFTSGYVGGRLDAVMNGIGDLCMAFPPMVIVLSLMGIFSSNVSGLIMAIIIASWPWYAKIIRSMVLVEKKQAYVTAAKICGSNHFKIIFVHILPNVLNTVVVMYFTGISNMILMVSGFSYLGIGFGQEIPEWGTMLSNAKSYIFTRPELLVIPGICIFITSMGFNLVGESIRNGEA